MNAKNIRNIDVPFVERAWTAVEHAANTTGDTRSDVINRAAITYALIHDIAAAGGGYVTLSGLDGSKVKLVVRKQRVAGRWRHLLDRLRRRPAPVHRCTTDCFAVPERASMPVT